jgi:N-succinyldiaminopimelate aminotransferase
MGTTIFTVMSALAVEHGAINLGQGFPDEDGPRAIRDAAAKALIEGPNQYPPDAGTHRTAPRHRSTRETLLRLSFDPDTEVLVTSGGTEALTASIMGSSVRATRSC